MSPLESSMALLWRETRSAQERLEELKMLSLENRWLVGATQLGASGGHVAGTMGLHSTEGVQRDSGALGQGPWTLGTVSHLC